MPHDDGGLSIGRRFGEASQYLPVLRILQSFHRLFRAQPEQLIHLVLGRGVYERALRGPEVDPAVGLQTLQGFTHRLPADAEVFGKFVFDQVLASLQGALHDQVHDRVVDGLTQGRRTLHPARGSVGQRVTALPTRGGK